MSCDVCERKNRTNTHPTLCRWTCVECHDKDVSKNGINLEVKQYRNVDVERLARKLMNEHGLHSWTFAFNKRKCGLGICKYKPKLIELSIFYVLEEKNSIEDITDTILHEIAHALTKGSGHGWLWRQKCTEIGANPVRCGKSNVVMPKGKFVYECVSCGKEYCKHRRLRTQRACNECCIVHNYGKFSKDYIIRLKK